MKGIVRQIPSLSITRNDYIVIRGSIAKVVDIPAPKTLALQGLLGGIYGKEFKEPVSNSSVFVIENGKRIIRISNYDYYHVLRNNLLNREVDFSVKYYKVARRGYLENISRAILSR